MINKSFDQIGKEDIEALIAEQRAEIKTLEYKLELPGGSDGQVKEFLADVSSFGNAAGGDIIYGVKAELDDRGKPTGKPEEIVPITGSTGDEAVLRLESMIRDGTDPRLRVQAKAVDGFEGGGFVLVLRVPRSLSAPHMVKFRNTSRFYARTSAGKYQLDVAEIRNAFVGAEAHTERLRRFLDDRRAKILADETPMPLMARPRIVLHLLPLASFAPGYSVDVVPLRNRPEVLRPIGSFGLSPRIGFDGFLTHSAPIEDGPEVPCYAMLFRNGVIEAVNDCFKRRCFRRQRSR